MVADRNVSEVHFANAASSEALVSECRDENVEWVVDVPNDILTSGRTITCYCFANGTTVAEEDFEVIDRAKPAGYIYDQTEVTQNKPLKRYFSGTHANKTKITFDNINTSRMVMLYSCHLKNITTSATTTSGTLNIKFYDKDDNQISHFTVSVYTDKYTGSNYTK